MRLYHNLYIVIDDYILFNIKNKLRKLSKICKTFLIIKYIPIKYNRNIRDNILQKYLHLQQIHISFNKYITDNGIKHLNLYILYASDSNITDNGIKNMNLYKLIANYSYITKQGILHMSNLCYLENNK
jgi:hypothetical protein